MNSIKSTPNTLQGTIIKKIVNNSIDISELDCTRLYSLLKNIVEEKIQLDDVTLALFLNLLINNLKCSDLNY